MGNVVTAQARLREYTQHRKADPPLYISEAFPMLHPHESPALKTWRNR